jgi:uncharacterized membrane protein
MIRFAWETFKARPWYFIGIQLLISLISGGLSMLTDGIDMGLSALDLVALGSAVSAILSWIFQMMISLGTLRFYLKAHDDVHSLKFAEFGKMDNFWNYAFTYILYGLIVVAGFLLLVIPGIIWSYKYFFAPYLAAERGLGPIEALKESARLTNGNKWRMFVMFSVLAIVALCGLLALFVGLLVAIPVMTIAQIHLYRVSAQNLANGIPHPPLSKKEKWAGAGAFLILFLLGFVLTIALLAFANGLFRPLPSAEATGTATSTEEQMVRPGADPRLPNIE